MANVLLVQLHPLAAETASGVSESFDVGTLRKVARIRGQAQAITGTPASFATRVQSSDDNSTWRDVKVIGGRSEVDDFAVRLGRYVRLSWTLAGDVTAATFSFEAECHQLFADIADLSRADMPSEVLDAIEDDVKLSALIDASCDAEDALAASNPGELTRWPSSLTRRCSDIAIYLIMKHRGFQPQGSDELIVKAHDDAQRWLKDVAAGRIRPPGLSPKTKLGPQTSSGNPMAPTVYKRRMSDNFGDF